MTEYYVVDQGKPVGPMSLEEILKFGIKPDTLVWKTGLPEWLAAKEFEELQPVFNQPPRIEPEERIWFAMLGGTRQVGPLSPTELLEEGLTRDTPVWAPGMTDWQPASTRKELEHLFNPGNMPPFGQNPYNNPDNPFASNPQYNPNHKYGQNKPFGQYHSYDHNNRYGNYGSQRPYDPYGRYDRRGMKTNWLPWAIGATVIGFLCSCIGAIFGIIGIVQANKANTLYSQGNEMEGDRVNGNAKIMTILGYIFAGIGILFVVFGGISGFFSYMV